MKLCFIRKKTKTKDKIAIKNNNISSYVAEESTLLGQVIEFIRTNQIPSCQSSLKMYQ